MNSTFVADVRTPLTPYISRERIMLLTHDSERSRQGPLVQVRLGFAAPSFLSRQKESRSLGPMGFPCWLVTRWLRLLLRLVSAMNHTTSASPWKVIFGILYVAPC